MFATIAIFVSACFFVGCNDMKDPNNNQTTQQPGDTGSGTGNGTTSGEGNTPGKPIITPDGDGIQFPAIP